MRLYSLVWMATVGLGLTLWGCAGSMEGALSQSQTIMSIKPAKGYVKKVAMVQTPLPKALFERKAGDLFFKTLAETIRDESAELQLQTSKNDGLPGFMAALHRSIRPINIEALTREGRRNGYNGLIITALHNVRTKAYKSGIIGFRKTRYRVMFEITLDLYDPFTGAKIISMMKEGSAKISEAAHDDFKQGAITSLEDLDEVLVGLAEEIGESVAESLEALRWQVYVIEVDGARIRLAAGGQSGLQIGQRLAVVKGQRVMEGAQGERFIVPGLKIGEIAITQVGDQTAEAKADTPGKIEAGDIAIPVN